MGLVTIEYENYLRSDAWKAKRKQAIESALFKCQRCGIDGNYATLQVHHLTYARIYRELPQDLMVVCEECHHVEDNKRKFKKRMEGWARKVYGEDWENYRDPFEIEEEFQDWLERRGEF